MVQFWQDGGRIKLPKKLVPPLHGSMQDGWYPLQNVIMGDGTITASYKLNGLNKSKIRIDCASGAIRIKGMGQEFSGRCDKVDPGTRRF